MRLVAVKTHAAGDLLLTTPALRALKKGHAEADIIVVTGSANEDLAPCLPAVAAFILIDEKGLFTGNASALYGLYKNVKAARADKIIVFQPSVRLSLFLSLTGVPTYALRAANRKPPRFLEKSVAWNPNGDTYVAENYVQLAEAAGGVRDGLRLGFSIPPDTPAAEEITGPSGRKRYFVIAPGGGKNPRDDVPAKQPPEDLFLDIIRFIAAETKRKVVLVGGNEDAERCATIAARAGGQVVNVAGKTSVAELARVIEHAHCVITTDSLPLHIAAALNKETIALFGPSNPRALLPADMLPGVVASTTPCAPCYANAVFPGCPNRQRYACRDAIPAGDVKSRILQVESHRKG